jgi:two-component system CheB/CheR fusion protein
VEAPQPFGRLNCIAGDLWHRPREAVLRVLITGDDPDNVYAMSLLLRMFGHTAVLAANGLAILQAVAAYPPDVVLLDIGLPDVDGYAVARRLREQQQQTGCRMLVIAVTGHGHPTDWQRSWDAGLPLHLVKPVDPGLLGSILASYANAKVMAAGTWGPGVWWLPSRS